MPNGDIPLWGNEVSTGGLKKLPRHLKTLVRGIYVTHICISTRIYYKDNISPMERGVGAGSASTPFNSATEV
jgi:hypothetical protein